MTFSKWSVSAYVQNGMEISYTNRNQVSSITVDGPPPVATYTYDLNGNRITKALENGTASFTYDDANRLTNLAHRLGGANLAAFAYAYNNVNNRTNRAETSGTNAPVTDSYGYDAVDQVTGVNYGSGRNVAYAYDQVGNRSSVTDNGTVTSYAANNLNQYTLPALGYDGNGNLVSGNGWTYTYDAQNRLITASGPSTTAAFAYDAKNRCVSRTINGTATYFTYDGWNLIEDRSAQDALLAYYINGATIDEPLEIVVSNVAHFYHQDALGSTVRITDGSGQVEESYAYDVFGAVAIKDGAGNPLTASAIGNRFLFTGREWLKDVGLYDYRNRVYSQDLGRFLQTDPIRFKAGDVNIYRYVDNDPLNQIDPDGTSAIIMKLAVWAAKKGLQECVKKECKEPCAQCCAVVGGAGFAALTTGYTAGMLSCAVFTHPALILTCVAAYTAFDVKLSVELGQSVADCTAACESKKSIKPPDCCKP